MNEKNEPSPPASFINNFPVQTEEIAYKPEELVDCPKCARRNPPTRFKCFYCGVDLAVSEEQAARIAPVLRRLESWEKGYNVIFERRAEDFRGSALPDAARLLQREREVTEKALRFDRPLPLARTESINEAQLLLKRLRGLGVETRIVADETLAAERLPRRLRGLEFHDYFLGLIPFNEAETVVLATEDLALVVSGAIFEKAVEATEKRKKGESKIVSASETASDELLIDLYDRRDAEGYRIMTKGFDFSCLGAEKEMLARDNIRKLIARLQRFAPGAKLVDDYLAARELLSDVWEVEQRKDSHGLKRQGFGSFGFSNTLSSSNLRQFTKYSRLQWQIL